MIMEWKGELLPEPEEPMTPVDQKKPVRSAEAAAWEAVQAQALRISGLERPKRSIQSAPTVQEVHVQEFPVEQAQVQKAKNQEKSPTDTGIPTQKEIPAHSGSLVKASPAPKRKGQLSSIQRVVAVTRVVAPIVQKLLPLLDGNVAAAVASLLIQRPATPHVDLGPMEQSIDRLRASQAGLADRLDGQNSRLEKAGLRLNKLQQASDILNSEHVELQRELKKLRRKVALFARLSFGLLAVLLLAMVYLFLNMQHILP